MDYHIYRLSKNNNDTEPQQVPRRPPWYEPSLSVRIASFEYCDDRNDSLKLLKEKYGNKVNLVARDTDTEA
jgi:hypothetical protein